MLLFFVANVNNMWTLPQSDFLHVTERPLSYVMNYNGCVLESQRGQGQCLFIYLFFLLLCSDHNQLVDGGCRKLENNSSLWRGRPLTTKTHRGRKSNLWYALHIVSYYSRTRWASPWQFLLISGIAELYSSCFICDFPSHILMSPSCGAVPKSHLQLILQVAAGCFSPHDINSPHAKGIITLITYINQLRVFGTTRLGLQLLRYK